MTFGALGNVALGVSARGGAWAGDVSQDDVVSPLPSASDYSADTSSAVALGASDGSDMLLGTGGGSNLPIDVLFVGTP